MKVLVTGSTGFVGSHVAELFVRRGHVVVGVSRQVDDAQGVATDLSRTDDVDALIQRVSPDALVNLAAVPDIAPCKQDPELAHALNTRLPGALGHAAARLGARLVHVSTDQVFDGGRGGWREDDAAAPRHLYGETKLAGERSVRVSCPAAVLLRPGLVTGQAPAGRRSSSSQLRQALQAAARGGPRPGMFTDEYRTPVAAADLARVIVESVENPDLVGVYHVGGPDSISRHELALAEARLQGLDPTLIDESTRAAVGLVDERPADLSLDSSKLVACLGWAPRALVA